MLARKGVAGQIARDMKEPESLQQVRRTYVRSHGRDLSFFSGCDYFRMSSHPKVLKAIADGLEKFGLSVAASRRTTGNHAVYLELEKKLARFYGGEAALVVSNGYLTNLVVAQTFAGSFSHVLIDERSHVSPNDGAQFFNCPILKFKHRDIRSFAEALKRCGRGARPVVITDGMFSGEGSVAPLRAYLKLLPRDSLIIVDDAHGGGVVGKNGGGAVDVEGVNRKQIIQCVTLSKALGCFGGGIICSKKHREQIIQRSSMFIGSTPLPLPVAYAAGVAADTLRTDRSLRRRLNANADFVKGALRKAGMKLPNNPGPVIPFPLPSPKQNKALHRDLLVAGIFPSFLNYPGLPAGGYFRFVISSEHTPAQLEQLVSVLTKYVS